jgi:hypothetical protein
LLRPSTHPSIPSIHPSIHPCLWNNWRCTGQIFMKFDFCKMKHILCSLNLLCRSSNFSKIIIQSEWYVYIFKLRSQRLSVAFRTQAHWKEKEQRNAFVEFRLC